MRPRSLRQSVKPIPFAVHATWPLGSDSCRSHSVRRQSKLFGLTQRGNPYLRKILVHGARAAARLVQRPSDPLRAFVGRIRERARVNVAICALANKIARVAWAVLRTGRDFDAKYGRGAPSISPQPAA